MKIAVTSDLHGNLPNVTDADVLVIAGDLFSDKDIASQQVYFTSEFLPWVSDLPVEYVVFTPGNWDAMFHHRQSRRRFLQRAWTFTNGKFVYISDQPWEYEGIHFFGTDNKRINYPEWTDILITHRPKQYLLDVNSKGNNEGIDFHYNEGLKMHICGHIHEGYGCAIDAKKYHLVAVVNGSYVNNDYQPCGNEVQYFDI